MGHTQLLSVTPLRWIDEGGLPRATNNAWRADATALAHAAVAVAEQTQTEARVLVPLTPERLAEIHAQQKAEFERARLAAIQNKSYDIYQLPGRCANGSQLDAGVLWHAVINGYRAVCGQTYGRRSPGWSSWQPENVQVTCPRCLRIIERLSKGAA